MARMRAGWCAAAVSAALLGLSGCKGVTVAADGASPTAAPTRVAAYAPYVALGDSYTAGPLIPTQYGTPAGCMRSTRNYPSLVAEGLGLHGADFTDVSCSGATADGMGESETTQDGTAGPQLDALSDATRLVTVGAGGNDAGYFTVLETCAKLDVEAKAAGDAASAPCQSHYGDGGMRRRIQTARTHLTALLADVAQRAPHAKVVVVGYPSLFPAHDSGCGSLLLASGDVAFLRTAEQQLDAALREAAATAGARYVDTYSGSQGHDACENADQRWIEPLLPSQHAEPLHPNEAGEAGMAQAVLAALGRG